MEYRQLVRCDALCNMFIQSVRPIWSDTVPTPPWIGREKRLQCLNALFELVMIPLSFVIFIISDMCIHDDRLHDQQQCETFTFLALRSFDVISMIICDIYGPYPFSCVTFMSFDGLEEGTPTPLLFSRQIVVMYKNALFVPELDTDRCLSSQC